MALINTTSNPKTAEFPNNGIRGKVLGGIHNFMERKTPVINAVQTVLRIHRRRKSSEIWLGFLLIVLNMLTNLCVIRRVSY